MPDVKPRPTAGAMRRSVNSADQKGIGSGPATATEFIPTLFDYPRDAVNQAAARRASLTQQADLRLLSPIADTRSGH